MEYDLVITNVKIIRENDFVEASIGVEDGKISTISKIEPKGAHIVDGEGRLMIPGAIDPHAHMWDPEFHYREDFKSGSASALLGGITTVIDMPLVHDVDDRKKVLERIRMGEESSRVDFSLHAGFMRDENFANIPEILKLGVRSFKVFTCMPYEASGEAILRMMGFSSIGAIFTFHAEDGPLLSYLHEMLSRSKEQVAVHEARPPEAEELAIYRVGIYASFTNGRVHVAHLSSAKGLGALKTLKRIGVDISAETAPHYLIFTRKDVEKWGPYLKLAPSLKFEADREALWTGLYDGSIDMIATDHAPCPKEEKDVRYDDPWKAWGGIPGLATMVPLLFTYGVLGGRISPARFLDIVSRNAARRFGLPGKGTIATGYDADLALIDPRNERAVKGDLYRSGWTPYQGMKLKGWPVKVFLRGTLAMDSGEVLLKPGAGKFVKMSTT